jgi:HEAT repeat protein
MTSSLPIRSLLLALQVSLVSLGTLPTLSAQATSPKSAQTAQTSRVKPTSPIAPDLTTAVPASIEQLITTLESPTTPFPKRLQAMAAIANTGADAEMAVPALTEALSDRNPQIRLKSTQTIAAIGSRAKAAVPELMIALKDPNEAVRMGATVAIGKLGSDAKAAIPGLIEALSDTSSGVRSHATFALASMGSDAKIALPQLMEALTDDDPDIRKGAITALGRLGKDAKPAVSGLAQLLNDPDSSVRLNALTALSRIGADAEAAVPDLQKLLQSRDREMRSFAALALGRIGASAEAAIPDLTKALSDPDKDVRLNTAAALGRIGSASQAAIPALTAQLKDANIGVRLSAAAALGRIAGGLQDGAGKLERQSLEDGIAGLEKALPLLEDRENGFSEDVATAVRRSLSVLKAQRDSRMFDRVWQWTQENPAFALIGFYILATPAFWFLVLLVRPLWLLKLNDALKPYTDFELPTPLGNTIKVPLRFVMFIGWLHYHPRVLDAWVKQQIPIAQEAFAHKSTVSDRQVYIPIPVVLQGNTIPELRGNDLHSTFWDGRQCLLIWGEGGIGKTSLACQLGKWAMASDRNERLCRHRMIPVLVEQELDFKVPDDKDPFQEAIRGQLQALVDSAEPLCDEFIEKLLRQRRILVIVDRLSELSEATRKEIRPGHPDFPANALIVTSRVEETLDGVPKSLIRPMRIEGNRLSSFLEAYLSQRNQRELFTDSEYFDACSQLSKMVGQRNITVLLAKLYAEQMIASKAGVHNGLLPDNIPDLMLSYLNELNRDHGEDEPDNPTLHQDAKVVAWECLKYSFRPAPAKREVILAELMEKAAIDEESAKARLKHLEKRLRILQTVGPAQDQICFALDPLAECLAALHLVELYGNETYLWTDLLIQADSMPGAPESIQGFLLAIRDCCMAKIAEMEIPEFVLDDLGQRVGLSAETLRKAQIEQRIARLAPKLSDGVLETRLRAIRELGELGSAARPVLAALLKEFHDSDWRIRQEVARTIGEMGAEARTAIPTLVDRMRDPDRRVATESIAALGKLGTVAIPALISALESKTAYIRSCAAWVLADFEEQARAAVPALIRVLQDEDWQVRWVSAYALGAIGADAKPAIPHLVAICKGEYVLVRQEASRALWRINGEEASTIVTALGR